MTRWRANAKLTLSLRVLGRRPDGYHDLDAIVVSISEPHDELDIELTDGPGVTLTVDGPAADGVRADDDNLAARAARLLGASGVRIALHKQIPAGAGLGGGSADAAAVLVALNEILELGKTREALTQLGASLGSDVPFCVHGGAARMRGRGEIIEPIEVVGRRVVVSIPPFGIATPAVYRAWDLLGAPEARREFAADFGLPLLGNDLDLASEHVEPRFRSFRDEIERLGRWPTMLAGSGSAVVSMYPTEEDLRRIAARVEASGLVRVCCVAETGVPGVERIEP